MSENHDLENLRKLHDLHKDGAITDVEFNSMKEKMLNIKDNNQSKSYKKSVFNNKSAYSAWMIVPIHRYADFSGRSRRKEFWNFYLLLIMVTIITATIRMLVKQKVIANSFYSDVAIAVWVSIFLGTLIPLVAVQVRRLHDQDMSGWLVLINLIPYVGPIFFLVLMAIDGTEGNNRFGPDPKYCPHTA